jgi:photosystem II stability/assembly factor-like uncharacterized protein
MTNENSLRLHRAVCITGLIAILSTASAFAAVGSWSTTGPYGGSNYHLAVYEAGPSTLFAAGRGGLFRSLSGGNTWQRIEVGLPDSLYVQAFSTSTVAPVLYLTNFDGLYRTGNGGDLWVPISTPVPSGGHISDVDLQRGTNNNIAIATSSGAYVSTNAGSTWIGPGATGTSADFGHILFAADGFLYLGIDSADAANFGGAVLLKSIDGGGSWAPLATQPPGLFGITELAASAADPQRIYASDGGAVVTTGDGGATWSNVTLPASGVGCTGIYALTPHPGLSLGVFVGCRSNGVHFAPDATAPVWTDWTATSGLTANGVDPVQASEIVVHPAYPATPTIWTGTIEGGLFRTTNAGTLWSPINNGYESTDIRALAPHPLDENPSGAVILAGYGDAFTTAQAIYKSPDGGASWPPSLSGLNAEQIRSLAIDPTTVDNDLFTAEPFTVYAAGRSERIPLLTSRDGGIYKSTNAGASWSTIDNGIATVGSTPYMGTVRAIVLDPQSCAAPPCVAGSSPLQTVYVAGSGVPNDPGMPYRSSRVYKSTNAGASWSASETGLPLAEDLGPVGTFNYLYSIVVPLVVDPVTPTTLYLGTVTSWSTAYGGSIPTIENGVFKSIDGGANWFLSSNGLPRFAGAGSAHYDVLALAVSPANSQVLYAGVTSFELTGPLGSIFKSTDGGANWFETSTGIAGQDVRALFFDPADTSGDTVYAGTGGDGANPGGVYRTTDGGATWNSFSIGLPANAALALTMPPRPLGAPARIVAGTTSGVWEYTATADEDADGSPSAVETSVLAGDGNGDGIPDATQAAVASLSAPGSTGTSGTSAPDGTIVRATIAIVGGSCTQLNDSASQLAELYPPDPIGSASSHVPWGLVSFSLPDCSQATVRVTFHGASFNSDWVWRNYGPRIPGDATTFGWYSFAGAHRVDAQTWELNINASRQGNYRDDASNILFIGGPGNLPDLIFDNGFE